MSSSHSFLKEGGWWYGVEQAKPLVAALDSEALSELVNDAVSTFGLTMSGRADINVGSVDDFVAWEPVLRCLFDGRAVYEPGTIGFHDR